MTIGRVLTAASFAWFASISGAYAKGNAISLNDGWGVSQKPSEAIQKSIEQLRSKGVTEPKLIVTFFTEGIFADQVIAQLSRAYPSAKIFGETVYHAVFTSAGLHVATHGNSAIAMMAFEGDDINAGVSGYEIANDNEISTQAELATKEAIAKAGQQEKSRPSLALLAPTRGKEEGILAGLSRVLPPDVSLVGGTPTTESFGGGVAIANGKVISHGVAIAVLYSKDPVSSALYFSEFSENSKFGKVTDSEGRVVKTIDSKPAQTVYKQWSNGRFTHIDSSKGDVMTMETVTAPLVRKVTSADGLAQFVSVRPQKFMKDGSLTLGGVVPKGETLYYGTVKPEDFVNRAEVVVRKTLSRAKLGTDKIEGGIHIYCAGASTTLGFNDKGTAFEMVDKTLGAMIHKPLIGGFTSAEQGLIGGFGYFNVNLTSSMALLFN